MRATHFALSGWQKAAPRRPEAAEEQLRIDAVETNPRDKASKYFIIIFKRMLPVVRTRCRFSAGLIGVLRRNFASTNHYFENWKKSNESGLHFLKAGELDRAQFMFMSAIKDTSNTPVQFPHRYLSYANLGAVLRRKNDLPEAERVLREAIDSLTGLNAADEGGRKYCACPCAFIDGAVSRNFISFACYVRKTHADICSLDSSGYCSP